MSEVIILKKKKKCKGGGSYFYGQNKRCYHHSLTDVYELIRDGHEVELQQCDESLQLLNSLHSVETGHSNHEKMDRTVRGDTKFLNRIIQNGGLTEYAKQLESRL